MTSISTWDPAEKTTTRKNSPIRMSGRHAAPEGPAQAVMVRAALPPNQAPGQGGGRATADPRRPAARRLAASREVARREVAADQAAAGPPEVGPPHLVAAKRRVAEPLPRRPARAHQPRSALHHPHEHRRR